MLASHCVGIDRPDCLEPPASSLKPDVAVFSGRPDTPRLDTFIRVGAVIACHGSEVDFERISSAVEVGSILAASGDNSRSPTRDHF